MRLLSLSCRRNAQSFFHHPFFSFSFVKPLLARFHSSRTPCQQYIHLRTHYTYTWPSYGYSVHGHLPRLHLDAIITSDKHLDTPLHDGLLDAQAAPWLIDGIQVTMSSRSPPSSPTALAMADEEAAMGKRPPMAKPSKSLHPALYIAYDSPFALLLQQQHVD